MQGARARVSKEVCKFLLQSASRGRANLSVHKCARPLGERVCRCARGQGECAKVCNGASVHKWAKGWGECAQVCNGMS